MYSFSYLEPVCCSTSSSVASWPVQTSQEAGQVVWYSHLFQNFPQFIVIHTVKGFGIVNKAEINVFLELFCFFDNPVDVSSVISGSSAFPKTSLNIWKFTVHVLLKPGLENFEHYFTSVWDECNCAVVWAFFGIAFLWDWNENWLFPVLWPLLNRHHQTWSNKSESQQSSWFDIKNLFFPFLLFFFTPRPQHVLFGFNCNTVSGNFANSFVVLRYFGLQKAVVLMMNTIMSCRFVLEGKEIRINMSCAVFVTLNPG